MAESHVSDEAYLDTYEYIIFNMLLRQEVDAPSSLSEYVPFSPDDSEPMAIGESTILENTVSNLSLVDIDPQVKDLRESARALYLKANDIYIKTEGHKTRFIQILSGKRTVREQAELYEKYLIYLYDGPPANKANKPGKSFHEYGLAIDVIRNGDDSRLTPALESSGWVQAIADEGWHFQAESASDWGEIVKRMESEVSPLSNKYAENRVVYYENKKRVLASEPEYMNERRRLAEVALGLNSEKKNINITRDRLQKEQQELKQGDVRLKNQRLQVQQLKQQYTTMVYDRCPIGKPYNECTHTDLKLAFDKEKNALYNRYLSAARELSNSEQQQASAWKKWNDDSTLYRSQLQSYQERLQQYEQDLSKNEETGKRIERWRQEMNTRNASREQDLVELISVVEKL